MEALMQPPRPAGRGLGNYLKTAVLLAGLTALVLWLGDRFGGANGLLAASVFVVLMNFGSWWFSDRIAATLLQLAVSRSREYAADESGAALVGDPVALANALAKLESAARAMPYDRAPATAHLFIVNPLSGSGVMALFSTHPPIQKR